MPPRPKTIRAVCAPESPLINLVDLLDAMHIHTPHQLSMRVGVPVHLVTAFFKGHVFHGNNPTHVVTATAKRIAVFLFPDIPRPEDKLAKIVKGVASCESPKTADAPSNADTANGKYTGLKTGGLVATGYQLEPGRPYLVRHSNGKWELLIAPKTP